jgi:hypothetical protein
MGGGRRMGEWISVKKQKPKTCDIVAILLKDGTIALAGYQKNEDYAGWFDDFDEEFEPTHWVNLPPIPSKTEVK